MSSNTHNTSQSSTVAQQEQVAGTAAVPIGTSNILPQQPTIELGSVSLRNAKSATLAFRFPRRLNQDVTEQTLQSQVDVVPPPMPHVPSFRLPKRSRVEVPIGMSANSIILEQPGTGEIPNTGKDQGSTDVNVGVLLINVNHRHRYRSNASSISNSQKSQHTSTDPSVGCYPSYSISDV
jgi:hypothetical protein